MRFSLCLIFLLLSTNAWASAKKDSLSFSMELGSPEVQITNPDGSIAYYDGITTNLKANLPLISSKATNLSLFGGLRYFDLENTVQTTGIEETAQMIGPGLGIEAQLYILNIGYSYNFVKARHQLISPIANSIEYDLAFSGFHVGLIKKFKQLSIGVVMTMSTGTIDKSETGLSKDSDFEEQSIYFSIKYDLGVNMTKFLKSLVD